MKPQPFNMSLPEDRTRWYNEMKGYLCLTGDHFLNHGTDRLGREYALRAFFAIEKEFCPGPLSNEDSCGIDAPKEEFPEP